MKVLVTGSSKGIGLSVAKYFLAKGHDVYGFDLLDSAISHNNYHHFIVDVSKKEQLPDISGIEIIFNNAGTQNSDKDVTNNLIGSIVVIEKYAFNHSIKSILFNASSSARTGFEFPEYCASKAGVVGYMKNVAVRIARYGATCNSISFGGVLTDSNKPVIDDKECWEKIMKITPLKKWLTLDEVNEWVYFLTVTNKSMSGQDVLVDNGELTLNNTFVWPK